MSLPTRLRVTFAGGAAGEWPVTDVRPVVGEALGQVARLALLEGNYDQPFAQVEGSVWQWRGVTSYDRHVDVEERAALVAQQPRLDRPRAMRAALIPITKPAAWWALPQDERRAILEELAQM